MEGPQDRFRRSAFAERDPNLRLAQISEMTSAHFDELRYGAITLWGPVSIEPPNPASLTASSDSYRLRCEHAEKASSRVSDAIQGRGQDLIVSVGSFIGEAHKTVVDRCAQLHLDPEESKDTAFVTMCAAVAVGAVSAGLTDPRDGIEGPGATSADLALLYEPWRVAIA